MRDGTSGRHPGAIGQRLAELRASHARILANLNAHEGGIAELERLLKHDEEATESPDTAG